MRDGMAKRNSPFFLPTTRRERLLLVSGSDSGWPLGRGRRRARSLRRLSSTPGRETGLRRNRFPWVFPRPGLSSGSRGTSFDRKTSWCWSASHDSWSNEPWFVFTASSETYEFLKHDSPTGYFFFLWMDGWFALFMSLVAFFLERDETKYTIKPQQIDMPTYG